MEENIIEALVVEMDKFYPNTAEPGEELVLYRRLQDSLYDPTAIAVRNAHGEYIGYLDREVAENIVLPAIREGHKFKCIAIGEGEEPNTLRVQLRPYVPQVQQERTSSVLADLGLDLPPLDESLVTAEDGIEGEEE